MTGDRVPGDQPPAVVSDDGDTVGADLGDQPANALDVSVDRQRGRLVEATRSGPRQVDDVTGHVVGQDREEVPEFLLLCFPASYYRCVPA